ncbi:MAG: hypothetical protein JNK11_10790 [Alphaproteobacteria bacterium]|nr:hypothetical protein [Alphaproteobacteria bacterium]
MARGAAKKRTAAGDRSARAAAMAIGPVGAVLGSLFLRPYADALALPAIARGYLPLSRAWAAGLEAEGSVDRFMAATPWDGKTTGRIERVLAGLDQRKAAHAQANEAWLASFFNGPCEEEHLAAAESRRIAAADRLMAARGAFLPLHLRRRFPGVRFAIADAQEVERRHGLRLESDQAAFAPPAVAPDIERSASFRQGVRSISWLRFPLTLAGATDWVWARAVEPSDSIGAPGPTVVFAHGIALESEMWRGQADPSIFLAPRGMRSIAVEGPFHSRRRLAGTYGGEPVLSQGPLGLLDYFHRHVIEIGLLTAWARKTYGGPVAVAGVSLGALTAQLVATEARHWPAPMRPDVLMLVTTSDAVERVAFESSLSASLGVPEALAQAGWHRDSVARWLPLIEPNGEPVLPADRILMVLGSHDDLTHFTGGLSLVDRWKVPPENLFVRRRGHFTAGLGIAFDRKPLDRLASVLTAAGKQ